MFRLLSEYDANASLTDHHGYTALHSAAEAWVGNTMLAQLLLENGTDLSAVGGLGGPALQETT